jgi:hypothetical protein
MRCKSIGVKTFIFRAPRIASFAGSQKSRDTMCSEYNGWANWETWNMALWIGEDHDGEHILLQAREEIADFTDDEVVNVHEATSSLASWLRDFAEEVYLGHLNKDDIKGPVADAIYHSYLPKVEWYEIAKHYIEEAGQE